VLDVAVLRLPRIANLDEFQPLAAEPGVQLRFVRDAAALGEPDLVVIPGTKATRADLAWVRERGLDAAVRARRAAGTPVLGICGGYQMLGARVADPHGVEGPPGEEPALGLLPVATTFAAHKVTERVRARLAAPSALWPARPAPDAAAPDAASRDDATLDAYEIHMGRTAPEPGAALGPAPFAVTSRAGAVAPDGATAPDGLVVGTYLHGLFENPGLRREVLAALAARRGVELPPAAPGPDHATATAAAFDALAGAVRDHLDLDAITRMLDLPALADRAP
jgi:adenosylcobyric acid synthase